MFLGEAKCLSIHALPTVVVVVSSSVGGISTSISAGWHSVSCLVTITKVLIIKGNTACLSYMKSMKLTLCLSVGGHFVKLSLNGSHSTSLSKLKSSNLV